MCKHDYKYFADFHEEMDYIVTHERRNNLIKNLVNDIDGNTLVLFNYVEKHGDPLYELINNYISDDRKVFYVHGGTDTEDREQVRAITERESNAVIIASYGTFSTGYQHQNYTTSYLPLPPNLESGIYSLLVEFFAKEMEKILLPYMISLTISLVVGITIH